MSDDATTPDANGGQEPTPEPTTPPVADATPTEAGKTLTQAEVDKIVADRLKREREKYKDYNDLRAAKAELEKIKEAELTETERLQKQLDEAQKTAAQAQEQATAILLRAEIVSAAARLNFVNPDDAVKLIDQASIQIEDGKVSGIEDALKSLAEKSPYLIKSKQQNLEAFNPSGDGGSLRETDAQRRARLYGGQNQVFDVDAALKRGGGVQWPTGEPNNRS